MNSRVYGPVRDRPAVLVGTSAVALILATSRWGSNIGSSPFYITEALIAMGIIGWFVATRIQGKRPRNEWVPRNHPGTLFILFFAYVAFRFAFSLGNGPLLDWARDGVPYLYGILAFASAATLARSTQAVRARTMRIFWWAMGFHAAWASVVAFSQLDLGLTVPFSDAPLFQLRHDIDAAILGITAGMCIIRILRGNNRSLPIIGVVVCSASVLSMSSRAGLISLAGSITLAYVVHYAVVKKGSNQRTFMVLSLPVVAITALLVLPLTEPGERLLATIDTGISGTEAADSAQGTQRARELVWHGVIDWTNHDNARTIIGGGFGNNFLEESGTLAYLQGTDYTGVRSPHNWFIGNYARTGLIGLVLSIVVCAQLISVIVRNRKRIGEDALLSFSALVVVGILPVATLGVVLEAPHGAVPFWWAAGILLSLRSRHSSNSGHAQAPRYRMAA